MHSSDILALYDQQLRRDFTYPQVQRQATPEIVRHVSTNPHDPTGFISFSQLTPERLDAAIEEQITFFEGVGLPFEWKVFGHDLPPDLKERLAARGFEVGEEEALLALNLAQAPAKLLHPVPDFARRLTDPAHIADIVTVASAVWDEDYTELGKRLVGDMQDTPEQISVYAAYAEGKPVSIGWIYFHTGTDFASLWGGSTLAEYRGKGFYTALVAARVQEAIQRGFRFLTIDASPMSRPILEKLGFQFLTMTYPCVWDKSKS